MLQPSERETHLNMAGDDHGHWSCFTDDPYMIRRLAKLGITPTATVGEGYQYQLTADQVLVRRGKRKTSESQRNAGRLNLKNPSVTKVIDSANVN